MIKKTSKVLFFCFLAIALLSNCQAKKEKGTKSAQEKTQEPTQEMMQNQQGDIEVSDKEIETFIDIANKIRSSQGETRTKSIKKIEESDLGMQKYQQIANAKRNPADTTQPPEFTDKELDQFNQLSQELQKIQQEAQADAKSMVKEEGMTVERYTAISRAARQDSTLQKRLQEEAMKQQGQEQQPMQQQ